MIKRIEGADKCSALCSFGPIRRYLSLSINRPKCVFIILILYPIVYLTWTQQSMTIQKHLFPFRWYLSSNNTFDLTELDNQKEPREILIVFWTKYYGAEGFVDDGTERFDFVHHEAEGMFDNCQPPANRCRLTNNQSLVEQSEAIIFYARDLVDLKWPEFRSPEQRWIWFNLESPLYTHNKQQLKNLPRDLRFNWTLSYRKDSDVFVPYGPHGNSPKAEEFKRRLALEETGGRTLSLQNIIGNKTKAVAWMVSNCNSNSGRDLYVNELKKYIQVDVYGSCGSLKCDNCYEMLERDYKFYLSFENSICRDYVTEKFYNPLLYSTVPVVYGGADYDSIGAPFNSYIDVRNFTSAQHLANYLHFLDQNETAYRKYFDWRLKPPGLALLRREKPWCNLCQKLMMENQVNYIVKNEKPPVVAKTQKTYHDIYSWWFVDGVNCQSQIKP